MDKSTAASVNREGRRPALPRYRFTALFAVLILFLVLYPIAETLGGGVIVLDVLLTITLVAGMYAISGYKRITLIVLLLIAAPFFVSRWSAYLTETSVLPITGMIFGGLYFIVISAIILIEVIKSRRVTADTLFGAICVYLLIGISWGLSYIALEMLQPGSFSTDPTIENAHAGSHSYLVYYSFVTLTTLGFGDITPLSHIARTTTYLEAIIGQLYIAVLIARLVGLHLYSTSAEKVE